MVDGGIARWGRIDILHNNVGVSLAGGDAEIARDQRDAFDRVRGDQSAGCMLITCKHVLPIMRQQRTGAIVNISSIAAITTYPYVAYKATKSGVVAFTEQLAYSTPDSASARMSSCRG